MTVFFVADSIGKSFGPRQVLKSASVWAEPGRITALLGRNGCGKSTLLKIGAGLLEADQGAVHFAGRAYLRPRLRQLAARGLFYLPTRDLFSRRLSLRPQFEAIVWRFGGGDDGGRVDRVLEELEVEHLLDRRVVRVSGGERRRLEIAAAVIRRPTCLLADEPFSEIAPRDAEVIGQRLRRLADEGTAIIVSGHEVDQILRVADNVVWMVAGTTHGLGSAADARGHAQFRREYLGERADSYQLSDAGGVEAPPDAAGAVVNGKRIEMRRFDFASGSFATRRCRSA